MSKTPKPSSSSGRTSGFRPENGSSSLPEGGTDPWPYSCEAGMWFMGFRQFRVAYCYACPLLEECELRKLREGKPPEEVSYLD